MDQAMLIFSLEEEHQPPCQDDIEGSIKKVGLLNGFAKDGRAGQVALECRDKGWRSIYPEDIKFFLDQYCRDGKAGPAAYINDAAVWRQSSRPPPHFLNPDSPRPSNATTTTRKKFF